MSAPVEVTPAAGDGAAVVDAVPVEIWSVEDLKELLADHGTQPRNRRLLEPADHQARGHNPLCGDQVHLRLRLDDRGRIAEAAFEGRGCALSQASASLLTLAVPGLSPDQALALMAAIHSHATGDPCAPHVMPEELVAAWEVAGPLSAIHANPLRVKCVTLAWHALRAALTGQPGEVSTE